MEEAFSKFLLEVGNTRVAESVIRLLKDESAAQKYGGDDRNKAVEALAVDVEVDIGSPASIVFRAPGPFHDALQELIDEFWDFVDD
jgi:hypothetical protein